MIEVPVFDEQMKNIPLVLTIGVFDGLHIGHMKLISECVRTAEKLNAKSMVMTFSVNPKMLCNSQKYFPDLLGREEFTYILNNTGVNYHAVIDFSRNISKLTGEEFIARLCTSYNLKAMVVGKSFKCGNPSDCVGPEQIEKLLSVYTSGAVLKVVEPVLLNGEEVSSSLIRNCLLTGDFEKASKLLGRTLSLRNES